MPASPLIHYRSPWTRTIDVHAVRQELRDWWHSPGRIPRALRAARDHLGAAPAACAYAFTLFVTWWTLRGISDVAGHRLILSLSTNLHNMRREPVQVLVASAFWTEDGFPWGTILGFLIVMAFAERWLGTVRWILVFASGHVGATLIVATGLAYAVQHQLIPMKVAHAADVGTSYGFSAVLAALAFHLPGLARIVWAVGLTGWYVLGVWRGRTFTDYGHLIAVLIGFAAGGIALLISLRLERLSARRRAATPAGPDSSRPGRADTR
ncbi:rhomboid-like protein [Nocardia miyunensis]|uniref:rhomboid-like protein n=1 Tax=Nocardia miyunensis TaxID=282684 RepID=UPI000AF0A173|nr:rhomboid-like protein [Nocardia miyunensis]